MATRFDNLPESIAIEECEIVDTPMGRCYRVPMPPRLCVPIPFEDRDWLEAECFYIPLRTPRDMP